MPALKTGDYHPCIICNTLVWRTPSHVSRGVRKTCSKECLSKSMAGENNPFWGMIHSPEVREKIRTGRRANPPKTKTGPKPGWGHTPEVRAAMSLHMKTRWAENRDKMVAALPRGEEHHQKNLNPDPRYRSQFTPFQRREWKGPACVWCGATEELVLDHVIPVAAGGTSQRTNAQTLCQPCNLWKMVHLDRAIVQAILGSEGG